MTKPERRLAKLTWPEVKLLVAEGCAAILPVGATEAHGPHLPLDTDVTIAIGMADRAAALWEARGGRCVVLPAVSYSVTEFAAGFPGSMSVQPETARRHLADVLGASVRTGFSPVAVANAHLEPAHIATIRDAVQLVAETTGSTPVFPDVTRRRLAERLTEEFRSGACHAGRYESSLVLADDPDAVHDKLRAALPPVELSLVDVIRAGITDFIEAGATEAYCGRPADATPDEGQRTFAILAELLADAMQDAAASA